MHGKRCRAPRRGWTLAVPDRQSSWDGGATARLTGVHHGSSQRWTHSSAWRRCYANARKVLAHYGATLDNVVEEVLYVTVAGTVRAGADGGGPGGGGGLPLSPRPSLPRPRGE